MNTRAAATVIALGAMASVVLELLYAHLLATIFGGTVSRYAITIGLYLFAMGLGAWSWSRLQRFNTPAALVALLAGTSVSGPLGAFSILWLDSTSWLLTDPGQHVLLVGCHLPVVIVGWLAGAQLPAVAHLTAGPHAFSRVLGWDYLGGLVGALLWATWLYPRLGATASAVVVGWLCLGGCIVVVVAMWPARRRLWLVAAMPFVLTSPLALSSKALSDGSERRHWAATIAQRYRGLGADIDSVEITRHFTTRYQEVIEYELHHDGAVESCLNLGVHVQMCESWVKSYHHGLVDVPIAFLADRGRISVLLVGGGDWIPLAFLERYRSDLARVDQVDIDGEFVHFARGNPLLRRYHRDVFLRTPFATLTIDDGYRFLRRNQRQYDLILLDLPGLHHDELLPLYSEEFYSFAARALAPGGLVATWGYPPTSWPGHSAILRSTMHAGGLRYLTEYRAMRTGPDQPHVPGAFMMLVSRDGLARLDTTRNPHVAEHADAYKQLAWRELSPTIGARANSVLAPNLEMVIPAPRRR